VLKPDGTPYTVFTPYSRAWKKRYAAEGQPAYPSELVLNHLEKSTPAAILSLKEIGFEKTDFIFSSPEINTRVIDRYHKARNYPALHGTSRLSAHLRFGTVSVRKLVAIAAKTMNTG
jgi:deoxyribodipyrimidine photo-lyase